jgi:pimeloyl-ACP methyl ester carboxylesterase
MKTCRNSAAKRIMSDLAHSAMRAGIVAATAVLAAVGGLVGLLMFWSYPGRPKPFVDQNGKPLPRSLAETIFIDVNGVKQGMIIESRDTSNPVLLYVHGGMPDYFLSKKYPTRLEDLFTVVWWEQRGCGLSYSPRISERSITSEQLIADTLFVADYLRQRFSKDKIFLMAHSGGTFFGIQAAAKAPDRFHAYIGVAQMTNQRKSEQLAYDYMLGHAWTCLDMLGQFRAVADQRMVRKLEVAPVTVPGTQRAYLAVRDEAMHRLGICTMHKMTSVMRGILLQSLQTREYTFAEKVNLWRGKLASGVSALWDEAIASDVSESVPALNLPVYFFHGTHDYTVSYLLAKAYFDQLRAPMKGFYTFECSAHSPMFEEPAKTVRILRDDVLGGTNRLADPTPSRALGGT